MNSRLRAGISRKGLDAKFEADEGRVSNLLIEARMLRHQGEYPPAMAKFAQAAEIEQRLTAICREKGLVEKSFIHHLSAASCWGAAGDCYRGIRLCDELIAHPDATERLRNHVRKYADKLRAEVAEFAAHHTADELARSEA